MYLASEHGHITMPELVQKLAVPPEKRTNDDCELIAGALYVFITSMAAFKDGLCILPQLNTALPNFIHLCVYIIHFLIINLRRIYEIGCPSCGQTR